MANCEVIDGNLLIWENIRPEIKIHGKHNVVVFGKIDYGHLIGAIHGSRNVCYVGGQADRICLRADFMGNGSLIYIGSRTKIISAHLVIGVTDLAPSILIGERSMLSNQVSIRATDSHGLIDLETEKVVNLPSSIVVEPHVWIGMNASVLKGSRIGAGSIVGAGALVTSTFPPRVACAGIPAKVVRTGVSWTNQPDPSEADIRAMKSFLDKVSPPGTPAASLIPGNRD